MSHPTYVGLDVHKATIAVAVLRPGSEIPTESTIRHEPKGLA